MTGNAHEQEGQIVQGPALPEPSLAAALGRTSLGQLLNQQAGKHAASVAIVSSWQDVSLTYEALRSSCRRLAQRLLERGVRRGDHVVVLAGNSLEYAQLFFAVGAIGAVFSIINPTFAADEVIAAVEFLQPKAIFVADRIGYRKNAGLLAELVQKQGRETCIVQVTAGDAIAGVLAWPAFLQEMGGGDELLAEHWATGSADNTLCIQFTSGTTGPRKAAMLSHANLVDNALLVGQRLGYTPADVVCSTTPLFHCFALVCGLVSTVAYGGTVVLPSDVFLAGATLRVLAAHQCTVIHSVATMLRAMLDHPDAREYGPRIRLRTGIVAGSALTRDLLEGLDAAFGLRGLAYGYGLTEASCIVFLTDPHSVTLLVDGFASVGTLLSRSAARVVDEALQTLPAGTPGELLVSGHGVFQGYYKNPAKTEEAVVIDAHGERWLRTGDLVEMDATGRSTIVGRVKDMIKRGGENIFPRDVETVLEQHPGIQAAAVVGIPDAYWGETVGAFVQRAHSTGRPAERATGWGKKELKLWLRSRLAPHKMPEHVFWIGEGGGVPDELPINYSGKMVKSGLRTAATALLQEKAA